jgi:hypothetical protein
MNKLGNGTFDGFRHCVLMSLMTIKSVLFLFLSVFFKKEIVKLVKLDEREIERRGY